MTVPQEYGGHGLTSIERYVVTEELLAAGAPVAAHWIADRQIAPSLLRFGTEEQRQHYLPLIARGECYFAIGLSEPDAGSDLRPCAAARSRSRVAGGSTAARCGRAEPTRHTRSLPLPAPHRSRAATATTG